MLLNVDSFLACTTKLIITLNLKPYNILYWNVLTIQIVRNEKLTYNHHLIIKIKFDLENKIWNETNTSYQKRKRIEANIQNIERTICCVARLKFKLVILNILTGSIFDGTLYRVSNLDSVFFKVILRNTFFCFNMQHFVTFPICFSLNLRRILLS